MLWNCRNNPVNINVYLLYILLYVNKLQFIIFITHLYIIHIVYKRCPWLNFSTWELTCFRWVSTVHEDWITSGFVLLILWTTQHTVRWSCTRLLLPIHSNQNRYSKQCPKTGGHNAQSFFFSALITQHHLSPESLWEFLHPQGSEGTLFHQIPAKRTFMLI